MKPIILAIDIGTTSTKGLAVLADGSVVALAQRFYPTHYAQPSFAEQDPEQIARAVVEILTEVLPQIKQEYELSGISFSGAMHSVVAVDDKGNPLTPLILWADTRSTVQSKRLRDNTLAQNLYEVTGTPVHPMSPLCKLMWLKENQPEIFSKASKFISIKEFVIHKLTGEYIIDHSIASATGLFDNEHLVWYDHALELAGVSKEKLSQPVSVYHMVLNKRDIFLNTGINKDVPVIAGASDGCLAQVGSGAMSPHDLSVTLGTSGAVRTASVAKKTDPKGRIFNYLLDEDTYICGGATNNGTALLNWYANKFDSSASKKLDEFVEEVTAIPAGSDGLMALPFLLGERAPMYNPDARGVFFGVSITHTNKHFQKALLEGVCFELKSIINSVEETFGPSGKVFVSGGFTHSHPWVQMLSDVTGKELILGDDKDASSLGAAAIGFKAIGIEMILSHASTKIFLPNKEHHQTYNKYYPIFDNLYKLLETQFDLLAKAK